MPKSGQARVLTPVEQDHLFDVIQQHRYPEKNTAIMQISLKLGLRVQEIALLEIKEVCKLLPTTHTKRFRLHKVMTLPAAYTKGANALKRSKSNYTRQRISFSLHQFDQIIQHVASLAAAGGSVDPTDYYPPIKQHKGKSRDLPMVDEALRQALNDHLTQRLTTAPGAKPSDPLFITQKGGAYSPNTLQEHIALMLRGWAGIEKASSHSGRRALITDVIHNQGKSIKIAQKLAGHKSPSTTILYEEPPEEEITDALNNVYEV